MDTLLSAYRRLVFAADLNGLRLTSRLIAQEIQQAWDLDVSPAPDHIGEILTLVDNGEDLDGQILGRLIVAVEYNRENRDEDSLDVLEAALRLAESAISLTPSARRLRAVAAWMYALAANRLELERPIIAASLQLAIDEINTILPDCAVHMKKRLFAALKEMREITAQILVAAPEAEETTPEGVFVWRVRRPETQGPVAEEIHSEWQPEEFDSDPILASELVTRPLGDEEPIVPVRATLFAGNHKTLHIGDDIIPRPPGSTRIRVAWYDKMVLQPIMTEFTIGQKPYWLTPIGAGNPEITLDAQQFYLVLMVRNDEMELAGIHAGDYVLVQYKETADDDEIIVAEIQEQDITTRPILKRIVYNGKTISLRSESTRPISRNYEVKPRGVETKMRILGVVLGVFKPLS